MIDRHLQRTIDDTNDDPSHQQRFTEMSLTLFLLSAFVRVSKEYLLDYQRVWQSYFALLIILGYDTALLMKLSHILIASMFRTFNFSESQTPLCPLDSFRRIPKL